MSLNCIVAMSDRLLGREARPRKMTSSGQQEVAGDTNSENTGETSRVAQAKLKFVSNFLEKVHVRTFVSPAASSSSSSSSHSSSWQEQLLPLVVTLRDCVREAVGKAQAAMTFVVLQGAASSTVSQGPAHVVQRRHAVLSQAVKQEMTLLSVKYVLPSKTLVTDFRMRRLGR